MVVHKWQFCRFVAGLGTWELVSTVGIMARVLPVRTRVPVAGMTKLRATLKLHLTREKEDDTAWLVSDKLRSDTLLACAKLIQAGAPGEAKSSRGAKRARATHNVSPAPPAGAHAAERVDVSVGGEACPHVHCSWGPAWGTATTIASLTVNMPPAEAAEVRAEVREMQRALQTPISVEQRCACVRARACACLRLSAVSSP